MASAQYGNPQYGDPQYGNGQPQWGRPTAPRSGACFYRNPNFRGPYFCANSGENIAFMSRGMNDRISSIRTFGVTEVTIFQDVRYAGRWARVGGDVRDLRREGWNDRLSSLRVSSGRRDAGEYGERPLGEYSGSQNGSGIGRIETTPWRDDRADQRDGSGYNPNDRRGDTGVDPYPTDRRDDSGAFQYGPPNRGAATGPDRNNQAERREGSGLNGSQRAEQRGTAAGRSGETADAIVRRLYQEVLLREVDPEGLALFRNHISNDRWSEQDVRKALLQSPEYLQRTTVTPQKAAEQLVARAYRAVLAREPDPASRVYVDKVLREHWTEADVTRDLKNSPEYRSKHQ